MKKVFLTSLSVLVLVGFRTNDALAWANCTRNVPAGKFCKTAGIVRDCRAGCYCTGSKTAVGTTINVARECSLSLMGSVSTPIGGGTGIFTCPNGMTSRDGAKSVNDCFSINANDYKPCPQGCFCIYDGTMPKNYGTTNVCNTPAYPITCGQNSNGTGFLFSDGVNNNTLACTRDTSPAVYYFDEFTSEIYKGFSGMYGYIGDELITMPSTSVSIGEEAGVYQCPVSYPISDVGAKTPYDCYRINSDGGRVYYGSNTNITCAEGTYLPANASRCVACNALQNQVCPGGRFEKSDKIQGLRLNCGTGQYLPANATQCSACDESKYFCFGGIYDYNSTTDQGRIQHNGYVNMGAIHTFITCEPGKYVPANSTQCTACTGNYICPGGIFFTDATYNVDRGKKLCPYGQPNANHTACIGKSSKPSWVYERLDKVNSGEIIGLSPIAEQETTADNLATKKTEKITKKAEKTDNKKVVKDTPEVAKKITTTENVKEPVKTVEKLTLDKKINDVKKMAPAFSRSAIQQPVVDTETEDRKAVVSRAVKNASETKSEQSESVHEKPSIKRPSRHK